MSAVCGILSLDETPVSIGTGTAIMDDLGRCKVDNLGTWNNEIIFLGCALRYITPESKSEKLPYYDNISGLSITADAIIDNRKELISSLCISEKVEQKISDSQLILASFKKWGEKCTSYLIGDFAFAIWDEHKKELFCARDHVGSRTLYYNLTSNTFAFCTLSKPLLQVSGERELNDEWIANFLSLSGPIHEVNANQTVYKDIQQLLPAHCLKVSQNGIEIKQYWNPLDLPELDLKTDEEYEKAFNEVFFEAVHCRTRSIGPIGVMMSGGLDSGAVACVAAKKIALQGEKLKAYCAVPFSDYKNWLPKSIIADETEYIEAIGEHIKNIDITYCKSKGKNAVTDVDGFIDYLEQPYKFVRNFFWINEIALSASKNGCAVLLDGQYGNFTISFGDLPTHLITLYKKGRWVQLLKEIRELSDFRKIKYSRTMKVFLKMILPERIMNINKKMKGNFEKREIKMPVNQELVTRWNVDKLFRERAIGPYEKMINDIHTVRKLNISPTLLSQMGAVDTKMSLKYGMAHRDPTRDKRVIEFCLRVPANQYVRNGKDRYLIRRSMAGILPDKVRLNYTVRGIQNADWIQRLLPMWSEIQEEIKNVITNENIKSYLDINKIEKILKEIEDEPTQDESGSVQTIIICIIFSRFLNKFKAEMNLEGGEVYERMEKSTNRRISC